MNRSRLEPFFLDTAAGTLSLLLRSPSSAKRCVLFVPPFAEEMNKCRRQIVETALLLVDAGYAVLCFDLFGTGDSEGEFHDATWAIWRENVTSAIAWIREKGLELDAVIAARLGCSLAVQAFEDARLRVRSTALWQPVESGRQFMTQFLRLRVAASMMQDGGTETVQDLKACLARGEEVEVAGYCLNGELWQAVEQLELTSHINEGLGRLSMWEIGRNPEGELSVPGKRLLSSARERGLVVSANYLPGEPFWSSTETVTHPELARRTARFIAEDTPR